MKSLRRVHTPQMPNTSIERRVERSRLLTERYDQQDVEMMCFQDEKDFSLQLPINSQNDRLNTTGLKRDIHPDRLFHKSNRFSKKLTVSCVISYQGISRPFFINPQLAKVNSEFYVNHLQEDLLPECNRLFYNGRFIFVQDGCTSHTATKTQDFLRAQLGDKNEWPPHSPDCDPVDYFFWNQLKLKVYEGLREPFQDIPSLQERIIEVWNNVVELPVLRRAIDQFLPRLQAVVTNNGRSIKNHFG